MTELRKRSVIGTIDPLEPRVYDIVDAQKMFTHEEIQEKMENLIFDSLGEVAP